MIIYFVSYSQVNFIGLPEVKWRNKMNSIFIGKMLDNITRSVFFLTIIFLFLPDLGLTQTKNPPHPTAYKEIKDDDYIPDLRESQERTPAYNYKTNSINTVQVNVDADGLNIVGDAANEPSIAIDKNNKNRMAIGWRQFNSITSNFRQAGFGYTTSGGMTWNFPGVIEPGVFRSDPVLGSDASGNFYYNSLTNLPEYLCDVFKSYDGGSSWDGGTFAQGGDKQWMTIDRTNGPGEGHIYAFWSYSYSVCDPNFFTRSTDHGASFQSCISIPESPFWGTLAVGPEGELYVGGSTGLNFLVAKSTNAQNSGTNIVWDFTTEVFLDGSITSYDGPNPGGLLGQTIIAVDTSGGPFHGNVYLLCSVFRNSSTDPADVMFARSTNGGLSFSSPIEINDDNNITAYQWFGTMSVAPTGRIDVIWLDTRNQATDNISALYYSKSYDGGLTWSPNERLSDYFNSHLGWPQQNKMGDYFDMISDSTGAHLAWAATFNGEQDVYYSYIYDSNVPVELVSFSYTAKTNMVTLHWLTATELNNHGFEIQRSSDYKTWLTIGFEEGKGTTIEPQQYSYTDKLSGVNPPKFYYRLKQFDFNGSYEYSNVIEVATIPSGFSLLQNYPNPFNPATKISFQLPEKNFVTLKVYDVLGNELITLINEEKQPGQHTIEYTPENLSSGVYFYKLQAGNSILTKKMSFLK